MFERGTAANIGLTETICGYGVAANVTANVTAPPVFDATPYSDLNASTLG